MSELNEAMNVVNNYLRATQLEEKVGDNPIYDWTVAVSELKHLYSAKDIVSSLEPSPRRESVLDLISLHLEKPLFSLADYNSSVQEHQRLRDASESYEGKILCLEQGFEDAICHIEQYVDILHVMSSKVPVKLRKHPEIMSIIKTIDDLHKTVHFSIGSD